MAEVKLHESLKAIRGRFGELVFKNRDGKLYISHRPDFSRRKLSAAQKESVARFKAAVRYAQKVLADPQLVKPFREIAKRKRRTVYNVIIATYMKQKK